MLFRSIPAKKSDAVYKSPGQLSVEGDASSASYFLALGAIGGGPVRVLGVGKESIQGDVAFADALTLMGALLTGDWASADASELRVQREASGVIAAYLQFHLERSLRSLPLVECV